MGSYLISSTFNLHPWGEEDFAARMHGAVAFYKEHGFDSAEFSTPLLDLGTDAWKGQLEQMQKTCCEKDFRFAGAHLPFLGGGGVKDEAYMALFDKKMHNAIDAMALLGVNYAVMHPNAPTVLAKDFDRAAQYDSVMAHLAPYADHAARVGLPIVVENMRIVHGQRHSHRYCQDPDELCEVADALGAGVCWDFGHANISGVKQSVGLSYVGKRLKATHVNDNSGIDDDHIVPFSGTVDWRDAMHGLALADYHGTFNFEISTARVPAALRGAFADYLLGVARELSSYIK